MAELSLDYLGCAPEHLDRVIELGRAHYAAGHPALDPAFLRWFYLDNPAGPATLVVAHEGGPWIGLIALIPVPLAAGAARQRARYAVNVLTHPEHRGKNLFVKMIRLAREHLQAEDAWLLGHPNANALPGWKRQKMQFLDPLQLCLARPRWPLAGLRVQPVGSLAALRALPASLWQDDAARPDWHVRAAPEFTAWRYLDAPHRRYEVAAVWRGDALLGLRVVRRRFKGPADLLVDTVAGLAALPSVIGSTRRPTLLMHPLGGASGPAVAAASWRLPVKRSFPFFATRWTPAEPFDGAGITLAASDF